MEVFYVENKNNFGIIINGWFYQIQKDASMQIAEYTTDYTYDKHTLDNIRDFIIINGSWNDTEPVDNFRIWFPPGRYSTMVFKYYGVVYCAHW